MVRELRRIAPRVLPAYACRVLEVLESAGYEAWIVGGWVRDALRGLPGHDVDVTTDAPWQQTGRVLRAAGMAVYETGTAHGTVTAVCGDQPIEVTTYRVEGSYADHRHPDSVSFVRNVNEDLARRDFTINAMAWHPRRGLLDPFGGYGDLQDGIIRAVGNPDVRLGEDALRVLRAVRFSTRFGFAVEQQTQDALVAAAPLLAYVAPERIGKELDAMVRAGKAGRALLEQPEVMCAALPELLAARGFDQKSVWHVYDVYEHTAHVCNAVEAFTTGLALPELRWAALLHDIAKPTTYSEDVAGHGHFFNHPREGARMARRILKRMAIPQAVATPACELIRLHDKRMLPTRSALRRLLVRLSRTCPNREAAMAFALFDLRRADAVSKVPSSARYASELDEYAALLRNEVARGVVVSTKQLAVSGADVMRVCNMAPGPGVGMQLDMLLNAVLAGEVENERSALLAWLA